MAFILPTSTLWAVGSAPHCSDFFNRTECIRNLGERGRRNSLRNLFVTQRPIVWIINGESRFCISAEQQAESSHSSSTTVSRRQFGVLLSAVLLSPLVREQSASGVQLDTERYGDKEMKVSVIRRVRQVLADNITTGKEGNAGAVVRLAFHDALSFDKATDTGGANGSVIYELDAASSKGLDRAVEILSECRNIVPDISWPDLISMAGAWSVRQLGGPEVKGLQIGREGLTKADPSPGWIPSSGSPEDVKSWLTTRGLTAKDAAALAGSGGLSDEDPTAVGVPYYKGLLSSEPSSAIDRFLVEDADAKALVTKYASNKSAWEKDFVEAYKKMSLLGTSY